METIKYFSNRPFSKALTGGQIYDFMLLESIDKSNLFKTQYINLENKPDHKSMLISPLKYIYHGLKQSNAKAIIFNSSTFTWFLPLMIVLSLIMRKNTYVIHHHFLYMQFKGLKRWVYKLCEWSFLKLSKKIVIPSPYIYTLISKSISEDRLLLWRIPFESKQFYPPVPITGQLTYTGTIEPRKGIHFLLEAVKILQDRNLSYKLTIIGKVTDESYYNKLTDYIRVNNLDVEFTGFISFDEKNKILSKSDIFVFPSLLEGFGMVLVEAQVYELPIVCFDNSSMPFSVFNNKNGFTVETGNPLEFANAIERLIQDRGMRQNFSKEARLNSMNQPSISDFKNNVYQHLTEI